MYKILIREITPGEWHICRKSDGAFLGRFERQEHGDGLIAYVLAALGMSSVECEAEVQYCRVVE